MGDVVVTMYRIAPDGPTDDSDYDCIVNSNPQTTYTRFGTVNPCGGPAGVRVNGTFVIGDLSLNTPENPVAVRCLI